MTVLFIGGSASGKSALAEQAAAALAGGAMVYIATMQVYGDEGRARVARHHALRKGRGFATLECPLQLPHAAALAGYDTGLLECVSNLLANRIFDGGLAPKQAAAGIVQDIGSLCDILPHTVVVTNQVFSDGGDYESTTRAYIRALGEVNRRLAQCADVVVEVVCGIPLYIKGKGRLVL